MADESDKVTTEPKDFETTKYEDEVYDPLEPINRVIFNFNNATDKLILEPVAKGYTKLPNPLQSGISNFLSNLRTPLIALNQVLQGQFKNAADTSGRFLGEIEDPAHQLLLHHVLLPYQPIHLVIVQRTLRF